MTDLKEQVDAIKHKAVQGLYYDQNPDMACDIQTLCLFIDQQAAEIERLEKENMDEVKIALAGANAVWKHKLETTIKEWKEKCAKVADMYCQSGETPEAIRNLPEGE